MGESECRSKIRCAMSDKTGVLRFESFDIVDAPNCAEVADRIRDYLIGQPLADIDLSHIRAIGRDTHPLCARVVAELVGMSQETFVHSLPGAEGVQEQSPM